MKRTPLILLLAFLDCSAALAADPGEVWQAGPHLLLDRSLVAEATNLLRSVQPPSRLPDPIITGVEDGNFQPYVTVVQDPLTRRFRIWYNTPHTPGKDSGSSLAYMESNDGIHWLRPHRVLLGPGPIAFGSSVIDEGPAFQPASQRFKLAWWYGGGLRVATSPDGFDWMPLAKDVVLPSNHDIVSLHWDSIRQRYLAALSFVPKAGLFQGRRIPHQSGSTNLLHWNPPWIIVTPDPTAVIERGQTEFYGLSAILARGDLLVAVVKVLRDDLNCEPGRTAKELHDASRPFAGIGYSVLAWSRDGEHWDRETEPFLDRNPQSGIWDRAMTWIDDQIIVGDFTYFYYGGYRWGHKADRFTERQIGFAQAPRDRYVGYRAHQSAGRLRTHPARLLDAVQMTVNADLGREGGELRVRILDKEARVVPGFDWEDCRIVRGNRVNHPVAWKGQNSSLRGRTVQFEFRLRQGSLYSFDINP